MFLKIMKNQKGISLVEVIASLVLITIALLSFYQLFINTHKTATYNNDKLVAIQLSQAELERIKLKPFESNYLDSTKDYSAAPPIEIKLEKEFHSGKKYNVTILPTQTNEEKKRKLINVLVTVQYSGKKSTVEGYVKYE